MRIIVTAIFVIGFLPSIAQDTSLLKLLDSEASLNQKGEKVSGTFKGTHVINMQTVEQPAGKELSFIMMHRFGKLNDGAYNFFGLDQAEIRLGFDYGVTDKLCIGIGRSSLEKAFDASLKLKLLQQGVTGLPFGVSYFTTMVYPTIRYADKPYLKSRLRPIYSNQLLIARKFNRQLSLQLNPTWIHYNLVPAVHDNNDLFALSMGGRMKFTHRMSINVEYNYLPASQMPSQALRNSFSLGWDIETGGHVFQLVFSNSNGMVDPYFISKTTGSWGKGDVYFGFNISRNFSFKK